MGNRGLDPEWNKEDWKIIKQVAKEFKPMAEIHALLVTREEYEELQQLVRLNSDNVGQEFFPSEKISDLPYKDFSTLVRVG